jgi:tetratricopeptide (TPR) repeat protein
MERSLHGDRDHPDIAVTLHELGRESQAAGDLPEAKQYLEESLRMKRSLHGDRDHPGIAATLHALGRVSLAAGDLPELSSCLDQDDSLPDAITLRINSFRLNNHRQNLE